MDDETLIAIVLVGLAWFYTSQGGNLDTLLAPFLGTAPSLPPVYAPPPDAQPPIQIGPEAPPPYVPSQPLPQPPPPQPPTGGGLGGDMIDFSQVNIVGGSPDVRGWPVTVQLAIVNLSPITPSFALPDWWADVIPPGFDGPIAYTVWAGALLNGQWHMSGFIEMWRGRGDCGNNDAGSVEMQLAQNWWYYASPLAGYLPSPGEQIAFMVTAGDARDGKGPFPVAERSNVVLVTMP